MCNKCHPAGHYDATLEQLYHDPEMLKLQCFPYVMFKMWWVCVLVLVELIKSIVKKDTVIKCR